LFIALVHEIQVLLQDERILEISVLCVLSPVMSHTIMKPVLPPHKVLINHIDYLLTTESHIMKGSVVVWGFACSGGFSRKEAKQLTAVLVQSLSLT